MSYPLICGIYKITSPSQNIYIGKSIDIYDRWKYYDKLKCKGQIRLYRSLIKYGVKNHKFEIIHTCIECELSKWEIFYIKKYNSFNTQHGLNLSMGGLGGRISDEAKKKISDFHKGKQWMLGRKQSVESKLKMSIAKKGIKLSKEHKDKLSLSHRGKTLSKTHRFNISKSNKGRTISEETKRKIGLKNSGKIPSQKTREIWSKQRKGNKNWLGKHHSEETKKKIRASKLGKRNYSLIGKPRSEETKQKIREKRKLQITTQETKNILSKKMTERWKKKNKKVYLYNLINNSCTEFENTKHCMEFLNVKSIQYYVNKFMIFDNKYVILFENISIESVKAHPLKNPRKFKTK